jgi:hypothetical protein
MNARDTEFARKMQEVLVVHRELALNLAADHEAPEPRPMYTVSVDEKAGVRALANTAPDLPPVPGEQPCMSRDHGYVRHGRVSILAAVDWHDGRLIAKVCDRHRSRELIGLLKEHRVQERRR